MHIKATTKKGKSTLELNRKMGSQTDSFTQEKSNDGNNFDAPH